MNYDYVNSTINKNYKNYKGNFYEYYKSFNLFQNTKHYENSRLVDVLIKSKNKIYTFYNEYIKTKELKSNDSYIEYIKDKYSNQKKLNNLYNQNIFYNFVRHSLYKTSCLISENILQYDDFLSKRYSSFLQENREMPTDINKCEVCFSFDSIDDDHIVYCDSCNISFHINCYSPSLKIAESTNYYCDRCTYLKNNKDLNCHFCPYPKGALRVSKFIMYSIRNHQEVKNVSIDVAAHPSCVMLNPSLKYDYKMDNIYVEPNNYVSYNQSFRNTCMICNTNKGAVVRCADPQCLIEFHIGCYLNVLRLDQKVTHEFYDSYKFKCPFNHFHKDNMQFFDKIIYMRDKFIRNNIYESDLQEYIKFENDINVKGLQELRRIKDSIDLMHNCDEDENWLSKKSKIEIEHDELNFDLENNNNHNKSEDSPQNDLKRKREERKELRMNKLYGSPTDMMKIKNMKRHLYNNQDSNDPTSNNSKNNSSFKSNMYNKDEQRHYNDKKEKTYSHSDKYYNNHYNKKYISNSDKLKKDKIIMKNKFKESGIQDINTFKESGNKIENNSIEFYNLNVAQSPIIKPKNSIIKTQNDYQNGFCTNSNHKNSYQKEHFENKTKANVNSKYELNNNNEVNKNNVIENKISFNDIYDYERGNDIYYVFSKIEEILIKNINYDNYHIYKDYINFLLNQGFDQLKLIHKTDQDQYKKYSVKFNHLKQLRKKYKPKNNKNLNISNIDNENNDENGIIFPNVQINENNDENRIIFPNTKKFREYDINSIPSQQNSNKDNANKKYINNYGLNIQYVENKKKNIIQKKNYYSYDKYKELNSNYLINDNKNDYNNENHNNIFETNNCETNIQKYNLSSIKDRLMDESSIRNNDAMNYLEPFNKKYN